MLSKIKILKGLTVSFVTTIVLVGTTEVVLRLNGYAETPAMYFDEDVGLRYFPNQSRRMIRGGEDLGRVTTNEWGFRTPSFDIEKEPDTFRIACLGDSFTLGWGVANEDTWPKLLQDRCDQRYGSGRVEVLNLGQPDVNTVNELRLYRSFVSSLSPDLVVLGFVENDLAPETLGPVSKVAVFDQWVGSSAIMRAVRVHLYNRIGVYQFAHNAQNKLRRDGYCNNKFLIHNTPEDDLARSYWEVSMNSFAELAAAVHADDANLVVAVFPLRIQVPPTGQMTASAADALAESKPAYQERIATVAEALGVSMLDLRPEYAKFGGDLYADFDDFHPGPAGMRIMATEVDKLLAATDAIPTN